VNEAAKALRPVFPGPGGWASASVHQEHRSAHALKYRAPGADIAVESCFHERVQSLS